MIYYVVLAIIILSNLLIKDRKKYCIFVGAVLILFAGLRANTVGPDTEQYHYLFNKVDNWSLDYLIAERDGGNYNVEPGYFIIELIFSYIGNYSLFKLFCSFAALFPAIRLIYKYSNKPVYSFVIFYTIPIYTMMGMSMMRQGLAFGIGLFAFDYIINKKFWKFTLLILIASFFHVSSPVLFPLYFFQFIPIKKLNITICYLLITVFYISSKALYSYAILFARIQYEMNDSQNGTKMFVFFCLLIFVVYLIRSIKLQDQLSQFLFYSLVYTTLLWTIGMNLDSVFRLAAYSEFYLCLYIPYLFSKFKNKYYKNILINVCILVCIIIMQTIVLKASKDQQVYVPYMFEFEEILL